MVTVVKKKMSIKLKLLMDTMRKRLKRIVKLNELM